MGGCWSAGLKAFYYELEGPGLLRAREEEIDERLGAGDLLASTEFTAVSPGTELAAWAGKPPLRPSRVYPRLVGYCNVARVVAVGDGSGDVQPGDHVLTHQSHRSGFRCPATDVLVRVRDVSEDDRRKLAAAYLYHLGYAALLRGGFVPGLEVAIVGLGALGLATAQLVTACGGAPVVLTGRAETVAADVPGARAVLPKTPPPVTQVAELSGMDGVDLVVNTSDAWDDFHLSEKVVRIGGTIVCLGFPGRGLPPPGFNPLDSQYFYDRQLTIRHCGHTPLDGPAIDARFTLKRNLRYLYSLILDGRLDADRLLGIEVPSTDLAAVYGRLSQDSRAGYTALVRWHD